MNLKSLLALMIVVLCFAEKNTEKIVCCNIFQEYMIDFFKAIRTAVRMGPTEQAGIRSQLIAEVRVTYNDFDFENELNQADGKLVIVDFFHSHMFPLPSRMVGCINKLAEEYQETVVWILVDGYKCVTASNSVLRLSLYPTYVFLTKTEEHCRFHGQDNREKDCKLIEHKIRELQGQTRVQVVVTDEDLDMKLRDAGSKLVMAVFVDGNLSESDHEAIQFDLEEFAKAYGENMVIIEANLIRCPHGIRKYDVLKSPRPAFVFIRDKVMKGKIDGKYTKEKINEEIKNYLSK